MAAAHTGKLTRIREVAMTLTEPAHAGDIGEAAGVSRNTAEKYLAQLVEENLLLAEERGRSTVYRPDPVTQYFSRLRELTEEFSKEELTTELDAIRADIEAFKTTYGVETADQLRGSVADCESPAERQQRRQVAEDWDYFAHQADLIKHAIRLYDGVAESRRSARV